MTSGFKWFIVIGVAVLVGSVLVGIYGSLVYPAPNANAARWQGGSGMMRDRGSAGGYSSNGERIYFTGTSDSGRTITYRGGPMWLYMHGGSCASCHGADGRGGSPVMMGTAIPSDIRYEHLIAEEHDEGEEHPPYDDELIKRAITEGLNPAREPLDLTMPRSDMSKEDLNDLLDFLKTLQ